MWRGARSSLPRLSFAALRPELAVATHRARPTAGPALAAALVVTRGKADGGGLFGSLRGKLEAAAEQGADLAKAKAAELEAGARKRAAELERKAGEIGAEAAAAAKAKSGVFEAEARSRAAELESKAVKMGGQAAEATLRRAGELRRRAGELENRAIDLGGQAAGAALTKAAALEAAAYRRAAELEGRAIGMGAEGMEAALSKAGRLEAYGQELARAKLNQLKDLESRATEFGTDYTDRLIQTRADVEAYGNVITEKKISQAFSTWTLGFDFDPPFTYSTSQPPVAPHTPHGVRFFMAMFIACWMLRATPDVCHADFYLFLIHARVFSSRSWKPARLRSPSRRFVDNPHPLLAAHSSLLR